GDMGRGAIYVTPLGPAPDIAVRKTASGEFVAAGHPFTYTMAFSNTAGVTAANVTLTDTLPLGLTLTGVLSSGAALTQTSGAPALAWAISPLAAGQGGVITLTAIFSVPASITNTAVITGAY